MENFKCIIIVFLSVIPATSSDLTGFPDVVFDGGQLDLSCRFDRYYGSITWYRGDVYLGTSIYYQRGCTTANNPRYRLCPSHQLHITSVDYYLDKDIIWKCKQLWWPYNEFIYTINFGVPVRNILLNSNSDIRYEHARVGEYLWFGCQITPVSQPISAQICAQDCFNISFDQTGHQSDNTILKVRSEMNRTAIYCTATYKEQVIRSSFKTIVLLEDIQNLDLKATSRPNDENNAVTIHEGGVINLICEALKAFPTPTIEIYIQSTNYNQSIVAKDTTKQLNYSLILTHEMHGADLSCKAVSGTMTAYAAQTILLLVLYAPRPSITSVNRLISRNSVTNTNTGNLNSKAINNDGTWNTVTLICTADAQPSNLTFSPWQHYIGNELIREVQGIEEGDGKSYSLEVSTDLKDAGLYICTVSNGINRHNQTQQTARYLLNTVKAEFHSNTTNKVNGRVGDYIELYKIYTCPMDCNITWYKDGTRDITSTIEYSRIPSYYNSTILIPSNKTVIKLTSIQLSDTATYTCNICNINGCINSSVKLTVVTTSRLESLEGSDRQLVFSITGGAIFAIVILLIIIVVLVVILHRNKPVKKNPTKPEMEIMENALYQSADLDPTFTGSNTSNNNEKGFIYAEVQKKSKKNENPIKPEMEIMENALYQSADLDPTFTGNNSNNNASGLVYAQVQKNSKKKDNNQKSEAVYYNTTCDEVLYSNTDERL